MLQRRDGSQAAQEIRAFLASYDGSAAAREIASLIRTRLQSEQYRREREEFPEWIDQGGEAG